MLADASLKMVKMVLDPCRQYMHDWMHALMSNGVLSLGLFYMLEAMDGWQIFAGYVAQWVIPAHWQHACRHPCQDFVCSWQGAET